MRKFRKIIKFIKKHRDRGFPGFQVLTTSDTIIIIVEDGGEREQLRIKY